MFSKNGKSKSKSAPEERPVLFRVIPPKSGEFSAQGFINALEALNLVDEVLSLELCAADGQVRMYVRSTRPTTSCPRCDPTTPRRDLRPCRRRKTLC